MTWDVFTVQGRCPYCGAESGEPCLTSTQRKAYHSHVNRVANAHRVDLYRAQVAS